MLMLPLLLALAAGDPGGWQVARWGMTEDQVLAVFPGQATRDPAAKPFRGAVPSIIIDTLEVG